MKKMSQRERVLSFLRKIKVLNWQSIDRRYMRSYEDEERNHRIYFDYLSKKFVIG